MNLAFSIKRLVTGRSFRLVAGQERQQLLQWFWVCIYVILLIALFGFSRQPVEILLGAALILTASLFPTYLWCKGRALGIPIFPVFALTHIWTCAIPIYFGNPKVLLYTTSEQFSACLIVAGFLLLGTFAWYRLARGVATPVLNYISLQGHTGETFFHFSFAASALFMMGAVGGWFYFLDPGVFSLLRGFLLGLNALGNYVLAYRWGRGEMRPNRIAMYFVILLAFMISSAASLLIVTALSSLFLATIGFSIGRKRIPILTIGIGIILLTTLHYGKSQMRLKYFAREGSGLVQPWDYPVWFSEWMTYSFAALYSIQEPEQGKQSFVDRSGTIHLLLHVRRQTSEGVPLMQGETYSVVPGLLIPRWFKPDRATAHEGTALLNIHFGLQDREETGATTIGWGLLNEAYANFGLAGIAGLALILGLFYGKAARCSANAPILSARSLFAMMLLNFALQSEHAASVYVTALFQSTVSLLLVVFLFMRERSHFWRLQPEFVQRTRIG